MDPKMFSKNVTRRLIPFESRYQLIDRDDLPEDLEYWAIEYRKDEIEKFDVFLFYWVLSRAYGKPKIFDFEVIGEKNESGAYPALKTEWCYYLKIDSGTNIEIRSMDRLTGISISIVCDGGNNEPTQNETKGVCAFIDELLDEIESNKKSIIKEYSSVDAISNVGSYYLYNMYLQNYHSAEAIRMDSTDIEEELRIESIKYDARLPDVRDDPKKMKHVNMYLLMKGSFFRAAILYYYMALEAFVNLLYHGLIKEELRNHYSSFERKLYLEAKVLLLPSMCYGFYKATIKIQRSLAERLKQLKDFRNRTVHGSINKTIKRVPVFDDGYLHTISFDKYAEDKLSQIGTELNESDVLNAKEVVDSIISLILKTMKKEHKTAVNKYILGGSEKMNFVIPMKNDPTTGTRLPLDT